jgi:hypothetical protein
MINQFPAALLTVSGVLASISVSCSILSATTTDRVPLSLVNGVGITVRQ